MPGRTLDLVDLEKHAVPVRLLNLTDKEKRTKRGTPIAGVYAVFSS